MSEYQYYEFQALDRPLTDVEMLELRAVSSRADRSPPAPAAPHPDGVRACIAALPDAERVDLLARVGAGQERQVRTELLRRVHASRGAAPSADDAPRTAQELLDAAEQVAEERERVRAEAAAREKARRDREAAAARQKHLDRLAGREEELWGQADALVASKKPTSYDQAVALLKDLRDLAARDGRDAVFAARIGTVRQAHAKKGSFLDRLRKAKL